MLIKPSSSSQILVELELKPFTFVQNSKITYRSDLIKTTTIVSVTHVDSTEESDREDESGPGAVIGSESERSGGRRRDPVAFDAVSEGGADRSERGMSGRERRVRVVEEASVLDVPLVSNGGYRRRRLLLLRVFAQ